MKASAAAHSAARQVVDKAAIAAARAAGQAVATAHFADHGMGASLYALRALESAGSAADAELDWQLAQLPADLRELISAGLDLRLQKMGIGKSKQHFKAAIANACKHATMKIILGSIIVCLLFASSARAGTPENIPSFRIESGDAVTAQVRLYSTAATQFYLVLNAKKYPSYETFIRQNAGHTTRIYVCGELLSELALPDYYATNELTFLLGPQNALDLAQALMKKDKKSSPNRK